MGSHGRVQDRKKSKASAQTVRIAASGDTRLMTEVSAEIGFLKKELVQYFEKERWSELSVSLSTVTRLGEGYARKALCLKSQKLQQLMASRGLRSGSADYDQVSQLFGELMNQLTHLDWVLEEELPVQALPEAVSERLQTWDSRF